MKFNIFGKKHKCNKCGMKLKDEDELTEHNRKVHAL